MTTERAPGPRSDRLLIGGAILMVLCCAVGPALAGAVAGTAIGGWLGIAVACVVAAAVGLGVYWRRRGKGR